VSDLQRALAEAAARRERELHDKRIDTVIRIQSALFDKAQAYSRIIIGLGYAGFFAAWAGTRSHISADEVVLSALLMTISLFFYIAYEVYQMIFHATHLKDLSRVAEAPVGELDCRHEEYQRKIARKNRDLIKVWYVALFLTIMPGVAGAITLISSFVQYLLTP